MKLFLHPNLGEQHCLDLMENSYVSFSTFCVYYRFSVIVWENNHINANELVLVSCPILADVVGLDMALHYSYRNN